MENNDYEIGTVFQFGLGFLKVDQSALPNDDRCNECAFNDICSRIDEYLPACSFTARKDGKDVVFKKLEKDYYDKE